ncbi:MAG TPA: response regulator [Burkholderiaceae bacterium]|nr:response regulator [Burkholderiaceae bacterium]
MSSRIQEMLGNLLPFGNMTPHVQEILNTYLLPIAIAIPLAILLYILGTRKGDDPSTKRDELPTLRDAIPASPPVPTAAPSPAMPPMGAPVARQATVPVAPAVPAAPAVAPAAGQPRASILIVEDSAVPRVKLTKLFQGAGYHVESANDGLEAMDRLAASFFSVLITDLEMPNMNGLELISAVQGSLETEDIPIIAITGHDELQAHVHEYQGLYGIFKKPWNDRELLKRVEALASLRKRPA